MINKYLKDKTYIIVTHRPKLTEICNKHYYFQKRVMLEKNNQLIKLGSVYRNLCK